MQEEAEKIFQSYQNTRFVTSTESVRIQKSTNTRLRILHTHSFLSSLPTTYTS